MDRVRVTFDGEAATSRVELVTIADDGVSEIVSLIPCEAVCMFIDSKQPSASALVLTVNAQFVTMHADGKTDALRMQAFTRLAEMTGRSPVKSGDDVATVKLCAHHQKVSECPYGCGAEEAQRLPDVPVAPRRNSKKRT